MSSAPPTRPTAGNEAEIGVGAAEPATAKPRRPLFARKGAIASRPHDGGRGGGDRGSEVGRMLCLRIRWSSRGCSRISRQRCWRRPPRWRWSRRGKSQMSLASGRRCGRLGETRFRRSCRLKTPRRPYRRRRGLCPQSQRPIRRLRLDRRSRSPPRRHRRRPPRPLRTLQPEKVAPLPPPASAPAVVRQVAAAPAAAAQEPGLGEVAKIELRLGELEAAIQGTVERAGDARRRRQGGDPERSPLDLAARGDRDASHRPGEELGGPGPDRVGRARKKNWRI